MERLQNKKIYKKIFHHLHCVSKKLTQRHGTKLYRSILIIFGKNVQHSTARITLFADEWQNLIGTEIYTAVYAVILVPNIAEV